MCFLLIFEHSEYINALMALLLFHRSELEWFLLVIFLCLSVQTFYATL